jgi:hypothetical protein
MMVAVPRVLVSSEARSLGLKDLIDLAGISQMHLYTAPEGQHRDCSQPRKVQGKAWWSDQQNSWRGWEIVSETLEWASHAG